MSDLLRTLREAAVIAGCGLLLGLAVNHRLVLDAFAGRLAAAPASAAPATAATAQRRLPQPVLLAGVREMLAAGALPVDARDAALFADGHLPGAYPLALGAMAGELEAFRRTVPPDRPLVLYCNGYGCPDSFDLGVVLLDAGYREVHVFEGGFPEWRDAGLPVERRGR